MKRIFLVVLMFSMFAGAGYADDATDQPTNTSTKPAESVNSSDNGHSLIKDNWKNDSRKIADMISEVRTYQKNSNDSTLQAQRREKQFVQASERMNKKLRGTHISLQTVRIMDVEPNKETGRYKIIYVIPTPDTSNGAIDQHIDRYSKDYDGIYISDDISIHVKIFRIEKSEDKAAALNKEALIPLEGKIKSIIYEESFVFGYEVVIELE
jgi:hypothetical protein